MGRPIKLTGSGGRANTYASNVGNCLVLHADADDSVLLQRAGGLGQTMRAKSCSPSLVLLDDVGRLRHINLLRERDADEVVAYNDGVRRDDEGEDKG